MPFYSYRCIECKHEFDAMRTFSQMDAEISCPSCSSVSPKRYFNAGSNLNVAYVGYNWQGKNWNLAKHRMEQSNKMKKLQRDEWGPKPGEK